MRSFQREKGVVNTVPISSMGKCRRMGLLEQKIDDIHLADAVLSHGQVIHG